MTSSPTGSFEESLAKLNTRSSALVRELGPVLNQIQDLDRRRRHLEREIDAVEAARQQLYKAYGVVPVKVESIAMGLAVPATAEMSVADGIDTVLARSEDPRTSEEIRELLLGLGVKTASLEVVRTTLSKNRRAKGWVCDRRTKPARWLKPRPVDTDPAKEGG